ncbi:MAG: cytochrome [Actinomycetia bacterium]|nr:cytochrome [Actinomycetes bacterium]
MTTSTEINWDPFDTDIDASPYETWRRMRDEAPLYRNDRYDFWALSRFDDVEAAHKDPATFSSAYGIVLESMGHNMSGTGMMIMMDPPEHTTLRHLVSRAFTPRRIGAIEDRIREICQELLEPLADAPTFDYLQDFGAILPSRVISDLVGVPREDQEAQRHVIDQMFHIEPGVGMINDVSATASLNLIGYLIGLLEDRERNPQDDMLTALGQAEITEDGVTRRITRDEAATFGMLLFTAGTETVARLLGNVAVVLADHPDQRADLAAHPDVIPNAVEELLRYEAPSPVQGRWTLRDVELHGTTIPKDSKVLLLTGSAGRDERVFAEADRFDVRRDLQHHVSFGYGIHFCVGAALARMEGRIALEETLKRFPTWEVDHDRARRLHTSTVRGWAEVPIST